MTRTRLILFDVDGTLVDTGGAGRRALLATFERLFAPASLDGGLQVPFAGNTDRSILLNLCRALGISPRAFDERAGEFESAYAQALHVELWREDSPYQRVLPGVLPLLENLNLRSDARVGLLTGNLAVGARLKLGRFDLNRFFAGGGFGDDSKDRRDVARAARSDMAARCGIDFDARDVVVIGDTDNDIDCAKANGFRSIAVETGWAAPGSLTAARPDALFADLSATEDVLEVLFGGV